MSVIAGIMFAVQAKLPAVVLRIAAVQQYLRPPIRLLLTLQRRHALRANGGTALQIPVWVQPPHTRLTRQL